jgi:hypothetical protein
MYPSMYAFTFAGSAGLTDLYCNYFLIKPDICRPNSIHVKSALPTYLDMYECLYFFPTQQWNFNAKASIEGLF